jgi:hypothetical protein
LCVALGGSAYAFHLGKNSVGSKQLKKNAVTTAKVKKEAITAAKVKKGTLTGTQINASTLGTVPTAQTAQTAQTADNLSAPEPWHVVGAPGEPTFIGTWKAESFPTFDSVAFYKDHEGIVHLRGLAVGGTSGSEEEIFRLPPGFRPGDGKIHHSLVPCNAVVGDCSDGTGHMDIFGSGSGFKSAEGIVQAPTNAAGVSLEEIAFRAES